MFESGLMLICPAGTLYSPLLSMKNSCPEHTQIHDHVTHQRKPPDNPSVNSALCLFQPISPIHSRPTGKRHKEYIAEVTMAAPECPPWEGPPFAHPILSIIGLQHIYHLRFPRGSQTACAIDRFSNLPGREGELWLGNFLCTSSFDS